MRGPSIWGGNEAEQLTWPSSVTTLTVVTGGSAHRPYDYRATYQDVPLWVPYPVGAMMCIRNPLRIPWPNIYSQPLHASFVLCIGFADRTSEQAKVLDRARKWGGEHAPLCRRMGVRIYRALDDVGRG